MRYALWALGSGLIALIVYKASQSLAWQPAEIFVTEDTRKRAVLEDLRRRKALYAEDWPWC